MNKMNTEEQKSPWISVDEKMPEDCMELVHKYQYNMETDEVLVACNDSRKAVIAYRVKSCSANSWYWIGTGFLIPKWWMPIPDIPKDEQAQ